MKTLELALLYLWIPSLFLAYTVGNIRGYREAYRKAEKGLEKYAEESREQQKRLMEYVKRMDL